MQQGLGTRHRFNTSARSYNPASFTPRNAEPRHPNSRRGHFNQAFPGQTRPFPRAYYGFQGSFHGWNRGPGLRPNVPQNPLPRWSAQSRPRWGSNEKKLEFEAVGHPTNIVGTEMIEENKPLNNVQFSNEHQRTDNARSNLITDNYDCRSVEKGSVMRTNVPFKPREALLRCTIVHYVGASFKRRQPPNNTIIICKDGEVDANSEIMCMASGYFYSKIKMCQEFIFMNVEKQFMFLLIELITKGRCCILLKRLQKFMKLAEQLRIPGVFASEESPSSGDEGLGIWRLDGPDIFSVKPEEPSMVRCMLCSNNMAKSAYVDHYKHYHRVLSVHKSCCNMNFLTEYSYIRHRLEMPSSEHV